MPFNNGPQSNWPVYDFNNNYRFMEETQYPAVATNDNPNILA